MTLTLAAFETALCLRGRAWARLLAWGVALGGILALLPLLWRLGHPGGGRLVERGWLGAMSLLIQILLLGIALTWTRRRLQGELRPDRLEEMLLTRATPREIILGKALAAAWAATLLTLACLPALVFLSAMGGRAPVSSLAVLPTLLPAALLGVGLGLEAALPSRALARRASSKILWFSLFVLAAKSIGWPPLRAVTDLAFALNPLLAVFDAWDGPGPLWGLRTGALWALALGPALWNARSVGDELPQAATGPPPKLREMHFFDFDARAFRRWRIGMTSVEDLARGLPAELLPLGIIPNRAPPDFARRNPVEAFDAVFGSRLFLRRDWRLLLLSLLGLAWGGALLAGLLRAPDTAGPIAAFTMAAQALLFSCRAGFGMAASIAADREKNRWLFLGLTPLSAWEILTGKLRAVLWEDVPFSLGTAAACALLVLLGAFSAPEALLLAGLGMVFPLAGACLAAFLAFGTGSVSEALFRISLAMLGPALAAACLAAFGLTQPLYHALSPLSTVPTAILSGGVAAWIAAAGLSLLVYALAGALAAAFSALTLRARLDHLVIDR